MNGAARLLVSALGAAGLCAFAAFVILGRPPEYSAPSGRAAVSLGRGEYFMEGGAVFRSLPGGGAEKAAEIPPEITPADFAFLDGRLYVSDAFKKRVYCLLPSGGKVWESSGADRFAVPNFRFALDISPEGDLWVANPGRGRIEKLDKATGKFIASWTPLKKFAFAGCCNPTEFAALAGGKFATMEKGSRLMRVFSPDGACVYSSPVSELWGSYELRAHADGEGFEFSDGVRTGSVGAE